MRILHKKQKTASAISKTLSSLKKLLESHIKESSASTSFQEIEGAIKTCFLEAAKEFTQELLSLNDINTRSITIDGKRYHRCLENSEKTYQSLFGPITVKRCLYRNKKHKETLCPLEKLTGIVEGFWTPHAARSALLFLSEMPSERAKSLLTEVGLMTPSSSSLDKLPKQVSQRWEKQREQFEERLRQSFVIPSEATTLAISLDGVLIPTRCNRVIASDSRYEEASCGTLTLYDANGDCVWKRQYGRMPEFKKKTLKIQLESDLLEITRQRPELSVIKVADGARDNWNYLSNLSVTGTEVLDFYHASEHLKKAFDAAYGESETKGLKSFRRYRECLLHDANGIQKVIQHLYYLSKKFPKKQAIRTELSYFQRNRRRAQYQRVKEKGWPIGSGVVEAVCKTLVTQRLKCSGMRWDYEGGQAILTFRALSHSDLFEIAWRHVSKDFYQITAANDEQNLDLFAA